jgi:hypothetical protein
VDQPPEVDQKGPGRGRGAAAAKGFETNQTAAINDLAALVDELEARVAALEAPAQGATVPPA